MNIIHGKMEDVLAGMEPHSVDAVVTDPPYELGFMGKAWDRSGVAFQPDTWRAVMRVAKPGAFLLAFGGSRTFHRVAVAIEDAGWELRDTLMWLYGTGMPKSKNVLKPAYEPIIMARAPIGESSVARNVARWGTGQLNIDAGRVPGDVPVTVQGKSSRIYGNGKGYAPDGQQTSKPSPLGRWPATVLMDEDTAGMMGETSRLFYVPKASKRERGPGNTHVTVKPVDLMEYLVRLVTPAGGTVLDPFMGSGTTLIASGRAGFGAIGVDKDEDSVVIARRRLEDWGVLTAPTSA